LERNFKIWRGDKEQGEFINYAVKLEQGMVVLDAIHRIQVEHANDLAVRWNCKAGKCGSCSVEINGRPKLACMTRMNEYSPDEVVTVQPMKTFPIIKDLVTDVSWNYKQNKMIPPFKPGKKKNSSNSSSCPKAKRSFAKSLSRKLSPSRNWPTVWPNAARTLSGC